MRTVPGRIVRADPAAGPAAGHAPALVRSGPFRLRNPPRAAAKVVLAGGGEVTAATRTTGLTAEGTR
jgi:hypothetical protein